MEYLGRVNWILLCYDGATCLLLQTINKPQQSVDLDLNFLKDQGDFDLDFYFEPIVSFIRGPLV